MFFTREDRINAEAGGVAAKFAAKLEHQYGLQLNHISHRQLVKEVQEFLNSVIDPGPPPLPVVVAPQIEAVRSELEPLPVSPPSEGEK